MNTLRTRLGLGLSSIALAAPLALGAPPRPGDYLVASRTSGSVVAIDPLTGIARTTLSGPDVLDPTPPPPLIGMGPVIGPSFRISLDSAVGGAVLARTCLNPADSWGLFSINPDNGDRTLIPGTDTALWDECGDIIFDSLTTAYSSATGDFETSPDDHGRVVHIDLTTNTSTLISGDARGDGLGMISPRAIARLDTDTLLVLEVNIPTGQGAGLFKVDIATGDRTLLSWLTRVTGERDMIVNAASSGTFTIGDDEGGLGPQINLQPRTVCVTPDGRILVGGASSFDPVFAGAILEIDPVSGDRTLLVGDAIDPETSQRLSVAPSNDPGFGYFDAPIGLINTPDGRVAFAELFEDNRILSYNPDDHSLHTVANMDDQLTTSNHLITGLAIYWPGYNPGDLAPPFGVFDFDDIIAFLNAFNDQNPIADSAVPHGVFDFDDVLAFLIAFGRG